jgi:hypothetical protein
VRSCCCSAASSESIYIYISSAQQSCPRDQYNTVRRERWGCSLTWRITMKDLPYYRDAGQGTSNIFTTLPIGSSPYLSLRRCEVVQKHTPKQECANSVETDMRSRAIDKTCPALGSWLSSFKSSKRRRPRQFRSSSNELNLLVSVLTARCQNKLLHGRNRGRQSGHMLSFRESRGSPVFAI